MLATHTYWWLDLIRSNSSDAAWAYNLDNHEEYQWEHEQTTRRQSSTIDSLSLKSSVFAWQPVGYVDNEDLYFANITHVTCVLDMRFYYVTHPFQAQDRNFHPWSSMCRKRRPIPIISRNQCWHTYLKHYRLFPTNMHQPSPLALYTGFGFMDVFWSTMG
jgi:hypothetical protein